MLVGLVGVDDIDHVNAIGREHLFDLFVEFASGEVPGHREVVERVAEDQVVLLGVLVELDELASVAPVGRDRSVVWGARSP